MATDPVRLLVVDDEQGFLDVLAKRMKRRGIDVTTVPSGAEAIQTLRKQDFDVAVVDLKLQDMDGLEVLDIFKKMVPELAVIMLTGHGSSEAVAEGMAKGACEYLSKPCDLETLVGKIHEAAGRSPDGGGDED